MTIREALDLVSVTRHKTLDLIAGLSQAQLDYVPAAGKWSVGEVVDHLLLAENYYRGEIRLLIGLAKEGRTMVLRRTFADFNLSIRSLPKTLLLRAEAPLAMLTSVAPAALLQFLIRRRVFQAEHPGISTPRSRRPAAELREELSSSLASTLVPLEGGPDLHYNEMIHQHPLLGRNTVTGLLRIIALHEQRHWSQIRTILASPGFPLRPST
jgi:hypothetical protein